MTIKLPPMPEPDMRHEKARDNLDEETSYSAAALEAYAREAVRLNMAPLSDEQIKESAMLAFDSSWDADDETLVNKYGHGVYLWRFIDFARAIEAAHGVKGD